ncbi:MAG: type IV secretion system DNA-binding domain-containing protein [Candidatus Peribacteria bacterium]|nr:MAG: type IV secretion system DNA-binding domain-containing protein [Candidatus Peribacteria bacterium]
MFHLPNFFFKDNIFTVNELSSLYHFPDGTYNRAPIIKWMDYKVVSAPDNLPILEDETKFSISGILAEEYLDGDLSRILEEVTHPGVTTRTEITTKKYDITGKSITPRTGEKIVEEDGRTYLLRSKKKLVHALKTYRDGILLGLNVYRNNFRPVYMKKKDRTRHQYIVGKSGTGKSVYISMLARQDIWAGHGVCVIDPHGDLVDDVLKYIPKERAKDVIYFDAGNEQRPMGLNLYEIHNMAEADRAVNDAVEIFVKMFGPEIFGPRIQEYFKYGSLTLLEDMEEGATLIDVPRLFTDDVYREYKVRKVRKVRNPVVRNFWERTYEAMGDREKQEIIPYFTSKFVSFITNGLIRNIIGQTKSAFNFREVMDNNKILLINLSKGVIGEMNSQLLGMIIVSKIYNAAMSRTDQEEADRKDFYLYVDEFQNFITDTFADILSEARKYKLCLIMAHQYIAQLESSSGSNI